MNRKPTKKEVLYAGNKLVPDIIQLHLRVLFCGINPGLYTAAVGHHFGRPGNRFWKALYDGGFTPRLFHPSEQLELLSLGYGITNIAPRASAQAAELSLEEIQQGGDKLKEKTLAYTPKWLAILGIDAYRKAFHQPKATLGLQKEIIGKTQIWVLPNPSGLNARYNAEQLGKLFKEFYRTI